MCDPILETLLKMQPHYSQSIRENPTPSSATSPLASYKEVTPVFIQRFFKIQNYCFASPTVLYACRSKSNNLFIKKKKN